MRVIKKLLIGNGNNIMKKSAIWNIVESMEYSLQSAILLLIVTRRGGLYDAGVFTIAYTFTQMIATIGSYGMRSFQVSDIKSEYKFGTYLYSRLLSVGAMILVCLGYVLIQGYDRNKIFLTILLCIYRVVDDVEDVIHGEIQKNMRLDIASKIVAVRIFLATAMFAFIYTFTENLIYASMGLAATAVVVSLVFNLAVIGEFQDITFKLCRCKVVGLLWTCFPICISGFLYNYLANSPKYAIDRNLSEEVQTLFSILFMPIFVINILSGFVFKPMIASMGITWTRRKYKEFKRMVIKQLLLIIAMTLVIMLGGAVCGVEVLGWLYGVELTQYRMLFVTLLAFGGFAAIVAFLVVVLTIVRRQKFIVVAYLIAAAINVLLSNSIVLRYKIWGAGIVYGITMGSIVMILLLTYIVALRKECKGDKDEITNEVIS